MSPKRAPRGNAATNKSPKRSTRATAATNSSSSPSQDTGPQQRSPVRPAGLTRGMILDDLKAFGYSADDSQRLMTMTEPKVDSFMQIRHNTYVARKADREKAVEKFLQKHETRRTARISKKQNGGSPGKKNGKAQIRLDNISNWVLFDHRRGYPPTLELPRPAAFERFREYQPGNLKIVAYNTESFNVALRKTPASFQDHKVDYTPRGPKLVKIPGGKDSPIAVD